MTDTDFV